MYENILNKPLEFGDEFTSEARAILTGLLNRDPSRRLGVKGAEDIKRHPFFHNHIDFKQLAQKRIRPPFKPSVVSPVVSEGLILGLENVLNLFAPFRTFPTLILYSRKKRQSIVMSRIRTCPLPFRHSSQVWGPVSLSFNAFRLPSRRVLFQRFQPPSFTLIHSALFNFLVTSRHQLQHCSRRLFKTVLIFQLHAFVINYFTHSANSLRTLLSFHHLIALCFPPVLRVSASPIVGCVSGVRCCYL